MSDISQAPAMLHESDKPLISLEDAREIVMLLEAGMQKEADRKSICLTQQHEESFYQQVGYLLVIYTQQFKSLPTIQDYVRSLTKKFLMHLSVSVTLSR